MKILTNKHLFERPLGNYLFSVPALMEWAKAKGYFLRTVPELDDYDMAQVESVLCAIERGASPSLDDAMDMVAANPRLAGHRMADDAHLSKRLIEADACRQWRGILTNAIDAGELQTFDGVSLLPTSATSASPEKPMATPGPNHDEQTLPTEVAISINLPYVPKALAAVFQIMRDNWTDYDPKRLPKQVNIAREIDEALGWKGQSDGPSRNAKAIAMLIKPDAIDDTE